MNIFLVTVLHLHDKDFRTRTWGYFLSFDKAEASVLRNATDMFEHGYYNVAVIEEMPEGFSPTAVSSHWYKVNYDLESVSVIDCPDEYNKTCNFSIG